MAVYFDASVCVSLIVYDANTRTAFSLLTKRADERFAKITSTWAFAETASVVSARIRDGKVTREQAIRRFAVLRAATLTAPPQAVLTQDVEQAWSMVSGFDQTLRAPDALHLAVARRLGASLTTFDKTMTDAARALGIRVFDA